MTRAKREAVAEGALGRSGAGWKCYCACSDDHDAGLCSIAPIDVLVAETYESEARGRALRTDLTGAVEMT
jgi:hypothetical protein